MRKIMLFVLAAAFTAVLLCMPAISQDLLSKKNPGWKVYNIRPGTNSPWDINQAKIVDGNAQFPVQTYIATQDPAETGSFAVYLLANYNSDMTGKTITATAFWGAGPYKTRSATCSADAYVRLEFQEVTAGPYSMNSYWWSTGSNSLDLNALASGTLDIPLTNPTLWSNICGKRADDTTVYTGPDCVGGTYPAVSPANGFIHAVKSVKQIGLSFGNACSYASGIAVTGAPGTFTLDSFTIHP